MKLRPTVSIFTMEITREELFMLREGLAYVLNASGYAEVDKNLASDMFHKFCEAEGNA